jgi:SRSO17 transposase
MDATTVQGWTGHIEGLIERIGSCFGRCDLRRRAAAYVRGLLGPVRRKNGWQLAEHVGDATPYGLQRLLDRASWDAEAVRDVLIHYACDHLLTERDPGVLIVDETGFLKKGGKSVGVQRQYSGTAGRIENCQVGVFLALAGPRGRALIDRTLYLPKSWCEDESRLRAAHVPAEVRFQTKPQLAQAMIGRALEAGLRPRWVLGGEVYGSDYKTRHFLESKGQPYVLAVTARQRLWVDLKQQRVDRIARTIPLADWQCLSVGEGSKGPRVYDWAGGRFGAPTDSGLVNWLLIRRSVSEPHAYAYYLCAAPPQAALQDLAIAAGHRWSIECCFESAKQRTGLDDYEVRSWHGWYRHITLSMLALALLSAIRAASASPTAAQKKTTLTWSR